MNIFGAINNVVTKITNTVGTAIKNAPIVGNIVKFVEKNPEVAIGLGTGTALKSTIGLTGIKQVTSNLATQSVSTIPRALTTTAATVFGTSAFIANPEGTATAIIKTPTSTFNVVSNLGTAVGDPTAENFKNIFTENPVASTLLAGAGALVLGKTVAPAVSAVSSYLNREATMENTQALLESGQKYNIDKPIDTDTVNIPDSPKTQTDLGTPTLAPERPTTNISTTSSSRKRRKQVKKEPVQMKQVVNLMVNNSSNRITKKYIRGLVYA